MAHSIKPLIELLRYPRGSIQEKVLTSVRTLENIGDAPYKANDIITRKIQALTSLGRVRNLRDLFKTGFARWSAGKTGFEVIRPFSLESLCAHNLDGQYVRITAPCGFEEGAVVSESRIDSPVYMSKYSRMFESGVTISPKPHRSCENPREFTVFVGRNTSIGNHPELRGGIFGDRCYMHGGNTAQMITGDDVTQGFLTGQNHDIDPTTAPMIFDPKSDKLVGVIGRYAPASIIGNDINIGYGCTTCAVTVIANQSAFPFNIRALQYLNGGYVQKADGEVKLKVRQVGRVFPSD